MSQILHRKNWILFIVLTFFSALFISSYSLAQSNSLGTQSIILVSREKCCLETAWPEAELMVKKELQMLDISVQNIAAETSQEHSIRQLLTEATEASDGAAGISIVRHGPSNVEVWIYDRITDKLTVREWTDKGMTGPDGPLIAAMRTVETLKASLLEIRMQAAPPATAPIHRRKPPSKNIAALVPDTRPEPQRRRSFLTGIGGVVLGTDGSAGIRSGFNLSVEWSPLSRLGLELSSAFLPAGQKIETTDVTTEIDILLLRGFVLWKILDTGRVRPSVGIGGGGMIVFAKGIASDEYRLKSGHTKVGYAGASAQVTVMIKEWFAFKGSYTMGLAFPEILIEHGGWNAATMGRPIFEGAVQAIFYL